MRIVIAGGPRTGKTTASKSLSNHYGCEVMHADDLISTHEWSAASKHIADDWMTRPGPWVIEGVSTVRALRKAITQRTEAPCDVVLWWPVPRVPLTTRQAGMAKGCAKVWNEIRPDLLRRGVRVEYTLVGLL